MHVIYMLDVDGIKKQLDQIKVMMNKTTLAAANTHERFNTGLCLADSRSGSSPGTLKELPSPLQLALPHSLLAIVDLKWTLSIYVNRPAWMPFLLKPGKQVEGRWDTTAG